MASWINPGLALGLSEDGAWEISVALEVAGHLVASCG